MTQAHQLAAVPGGAERATRPSGQEQAAAGLQAGDAPVPVGRSGPVSEVGELAEGGAGAEVGHRPRLRARPVGGVVYWLWGNLPTSGGRGGT